jgi:hypothetical protein
LGNQGEPASKKLLGGLGWLESLVGRGSATHGRGPLTIGVLVLSRDVDKEKALDEGLVRGCVKRAVRS